MSISQLENENFTKFSRLQKATALGPQSDQIRWGASGNSLWKEGALVLHCDRLVWVVSLIYCESEKTLQANIMENGSRLTAQATLLIQQARSMLQWCPSRFEKRQSHVLNRKHLIFFSVGALPSSLSNSVVRTSQSNGTNSVATGSDPNWRWRVTNAPTSNLSDFKAASIVSTTCKTKSIRRVRYSLKLEMLGEYQRQTTETAEICTDGSLWNNMGMYSK